ncbi:MAG TPA: diaminopimelate decarboxylase [Chloroflexota bacterium]|nr:diaminopimelate decarboxylase [Chloroflexota bacterium]
MEVSERLPAALAALLPLGAGRNAAGHLVIGGCDCVELAREYGTPLYVYDEGTIRARCRDYVRGLQAAYPDGLVLFAAKALGAPMVFQIVAQEGLGLDVVSGGELYAATRAGIPLERVYFHGNNKSVAELEQALAVGVGRIVVDNLYELQLLAELAHRRGVRQPVLLRVGPGVEAHTHEYRKTGILDSKFSLPISTGDAEQGVRAALAAPGLELLGLHAHIGSQILELEPYVETIRIVLTFAAEMQARYGFQLREFSPGGGWGIAYTEADDPPAYDEAAALVGGTVRAETARLGLPAPRITLEPGRSIVGQAGVALYTVGAIKHIPGVRRYVAVDGGMADNIRPALYGAVYRALLANRADSGPLERVTIVGKYCESGDVLIREIDLPALRPGDLLALPASGAYNLAMASNYNLAPKPAVVLVADGKARLMRRRQTFDDLLREEYLLES